MTDLVAVAYFFDPEEAFVADGFLRAQGMMTFIQNEHHLTMAPWLRMALGGYRLLVPEDSVDEATVLLRSISGVSTGPINESTANLKEETPKQRIRKNNWFWLPIAVLTETPFLPTYRSKAEVFWQSLLLSGFYGVIIQSVYYVGGFWNYLSWWLGL